MATRRFAFPPSIFCYKYLAFPYHCSFNINSIDFSHSYGAEHKRSKHFFVHPRRVVCEWSFTGALEL